MFIFQFIRSRKLWAITAGIYACISVSSPVLADTNALGYPAKPISWLVGWPAGGSVDHATRLVARKLEQYLGQSVVVENRPGASGVIALNHVAKSAADGYTLVMVPGPVIGSRPSPQIGQELQAVAMIGKGPAVLVGTTAQTMPQTVTELIAAVQAKPDLFHYASSGNGTIQHLAGELFNQMADTQVTHVPYKGGAQAVSDVVGGQVSLGVLGVATVLPHIQSGKLKPYAVTTSNRSHSLPDTPSLAEFLPGFDATQWYMVAAPAGTPADRIHLLNTAIAQVLKDPEIRTGFTALGIDPDARTPEQTEIFVKKDLDRWRELAARAHLQLE